MKKPLVLLFACLTLAVAAKPALPKLDYDASVFRGTGGPIEQAQGDLVPAPTQYRACRSRSDDHCIQLNERSVRLALAAAPRPAMGGPIEGPNAYPHCSRVITDECVQLFDRAPHRARGRTPIRPTRRAPAPDAETPGI
jgi:hypothetical protein